MTRLRIKVSGTVQGVGFRPFVYTLAHKHNLAGFVRNAGGTVEIEIEGQDVKTDQFLIGLKNEIPPLASISNIAVENIPVKSSAASFKILPSTDRQDSLLLVPPDIATCSDCVNELFDKNDRRYKYPFINCVNCGPRFTIIESLPYDRHATTMSAFTMCNLCTTEYKDPSNRRFHAQPNACPECGPKLSFVSCNMPEETSSDPVEMAIKYLQQGNILALKGLGGFQLVCDATNHQSVAKLRKRKERPAKPFALMMQNVQLIKKYCHVTNAEEKSLLCPQAPIVLLEKLDNTDIANNIAPNINFLGVMLPYTPLHHLLINSFEKPLVMTSGNVSEETIVIDNDEALEKLANIADCFLLHDRKIYSRYDDSVTRIINDKAILIRRARSYAPEPIALKEQNFQKTLALGGQLKNTFCFLNHNQAYISQHLGDLDNLENIEYLESTIKQYRKLFNLQEELLACDHHPDYASTKFASALSTSQDIPLIKAQHHHAHIVACMAEHNLSTEVIGIALDGTGYGLDKNIWGGEFFICNLDNFTRYACLEPVCMPGGDKAARSPWRMALAYMYKNTAKDSDLKSKSIAKEFTHCLENYETVYGKKTIDIVCQQIIKAFNSPLTSSCGRLFDAVSSMLDICHENLYEGQAAIELESAALSFFKNKFKAIQSKHCSYPYAIIEQTAKEEPDHISVLDMLKMIAVDKVQNKHISEIAFKFHFTLATIIVDICRRMREKYSINTVCLSGGVFQNKLLLELTVSMLQIKTFAVYFPQKIPANDGGISLGQAVIAASLIKSKELKQY